jgi:hypothetical protein
MCCPTRKVIIGDNVSDIAALKKLGAATDDRAALRAAISAARIATGEVSDFQASIDRAAALVEHLENRLAVQTAKLIEARSEDAEALAKAIRRQGDRGTPSKGDEVAAAKADVERELVVARDALERLREQLKQREFSAALAANRVVVSRNLLLAPVAATVLARIRATRIELLRDRCLLAALMADTGAPSFSDDAAIFFQVRDAEISRRQAFGEVRAAAAADAVDLAVGPAAHTPEEANGVMEAIHKCSRQLAALLEDANATLPGGA